MQPVKTSTIGRKAPRRVSRCPPAFWWSLLDRHELLVALFAISLALTLTFYPIVLGGKTLLPSSVQGVMGAAPPYGYEGKWPLDDFRLDKGASAWQTEPETFKIGAEIRRFRLPLWNPSVGAGTPLLADLHSGLFDPLKLPVLVSPSAGMWDLYLLGRYFLAGLVIFLFVRRLFAMSLPASLVTAVGYILSGPFLVYSNEWWLDVYFSLPLVLYGVEIVIQKKSGGGVLLLAGGVALNLVAGMPEASFLTLFAAGCYAIYRLAFSALDDHDSRAAVRRTVLLGVGFSGGLLLAAPALVPFAEFLKNAATLHKASNHLGTFYDSPRWLVTLFVPFFNGSVIDNARKIGWFSGLRGYVGVVLPTLGVLAIWHGRLGLRVGLFFLVFALFGLAKTYGLSGINDLGRLPVFNLVLYYQYLAPVITFCIAVMAGIGTDRIYRGEKLGWSLRAATAVVLGAMIWQLYLNRDRLSGLSHSSHSWLFFAFAMLLAVWLVLWAFDDLNGRLRAWACLALVLAELTVLAPHDIYRNRSDTFAKPPYIQFLQEQQARDGPGRLFGFDGLLMPNDASAYDLQDIRSLNALYPARYLTFIQRFISPTATDRFDGGYVSNSDQAPVISQNPMFDLLGTDYILTGKAGLQDLLAGPLTADIVRRIGATRLFNSAAFTINGVEKPVLFAHAPMDAPFPVTVTPGQQVLRFSAGIEPGAWGSPGDGVMFTVAVDAGAGQAILWQQWIDPQHNPDDRHWVDESIDLSQYLGRTVTIHLITGPGPANDNAADWSGWGDLRLTGEADKGTKSQFQLIYDGEVKIYRNTDALPRAMVLSQIQEVADGSEALTRMQKLGFDPARLAIVEGKLPDNVRDQLAAAPTSDASTVKISQYEDNRVVLQASMEHEGLVLLTDTNFPGWKAYVDGQQIKIYQTDYLFRGVVVPEGTHEIVFKYDPVSFKVGLAIGLGTLLGLLGWWVYGLYRARRRPEETR